MKRPKTLINWKHIEPGIEPHVRFLREHGYDTCSSCEHAMSINIMLGPEGIPNLHATLVQRYEHFELAYVHNPYWKGVRVVFKGEMEGDGLPIDLVLLKVEPDSHPLYFVVKTRRYPRDGTDAEAREHDDYYYGEHTCPTNWTDDIVAVVSGEDEDPHGFATFVKRIPAPEGMDADAELPDWVATYMELFNGPVPPSDLQLLAWNVRNGGMRNG